jgi:hypothetical protein
MISFSGCSITGHSGISRGAGIGCCTVFWMRPTITHTAKLCWGMRGGVADAGIIPRLRIGSGQQLRHYINSMVSYRSFYARTEYMATEHFDIVTGVKIKEMLRTLNAISQLIASSYLRYTRGYPAFDLDHDARPRTFALLQYILDGSKIGLALARDPLIINPN